MLPQEGLAPVGHHSHLMKEKHFGITLLLRIEIWLSLKWTQLRQLMLWGPVLILASAGSIQYNLSNKNNQCWYTC